MNFGDHLRAQRAAKGLTVVAASLLVDIPPSRLRELEEGKRLPTGEDLHKLTRLVVGDSLTAFLVATEELVERVLARDLASLRGEPGEQPLETDQDLFTLYDEMCAYLAERGRI